MSMLSMAGALTLFAMTTTLAAAPMAQASRPLVPTEMEVLERLVLPDHVSLGHQVHELYLDAVQCYKDYPSQSRGYPASFNFCLRSSAAGFAEGFYLASDLAAYCKSAAPDTCSASPTLVSAMPYANVKRDQLSLSDMGDLARLNAVLAASSGKSVTVPDLVTKLLDKVLWCAAAPRPLTVDEQGIRSPSSFRYCTYYVAYSNLRALVETTGAPGERGANDLAYEPDPALDANGHLNVSPARFNDEGHYYDGSGLAARFDTRDPTGTSAAARLARGPLVGQHPNNNTWTYRPGRLQEDLSDFWTFVVESALSNEVTGSPAFAGGY